MAKISATHDRPPHLRWRADQLSEPISKAVNRHNAVVNDHLPPKFIIEA